MWHQHQLCQWPVTFAADSVSVETEELLVRVVSEIAADLLDVEPRLDWFGEIEQLRGRASQVPVASSRQWFETALANGQHIAVLPNGLGSQPLVSREVLELALDPVGDGSVHYPWLQEVVDVFRLETWHRLLSSRRREGLCHRWDTTMGEFRKAKLGVGVPMPRVEERLWDSIAGEALSLSGPALHDVNQVWFICPCQQTDPKVLDLLSRAFLLLSPGQRTWRVVYAEGLQPGVPSHPRPVHEGRVRELMVGSVHGPETCEPAERRLDEHQLL